METTFLLLYRRDNCCLCSALEAKLKDIPLHKLKPTLELIIVDIDGSDLTESERKRYDLEIPVLFIKSKNMSKKIELPRVSPRLNGAGLFTWLEKTISMKLTSSK